MAYVIHGCPLCGETALFWEWATFGASNLKNLQQQIYCASYFVPSKLLTHLSSSSIHSIEENL